MAKSSKKTVRKNASASPLARNRNRSREPFAVTCEGNVYVNIEALETIDDASLHGRKLFIGAELGRDERRLARELLDNAGHELGAKIAGPLARRRAPGGGEVKPEGARGRRTTHG